jgi:acyl-CoA thioester hydrolase
MKTDARQVTGIDIRVYWEDTDGGGVVYYANYLRYFERARTEWLRNRGQDQSRLKAEQDLVFAVRRIEVDYRLPARLDDEIRVTAAVVEVGRSRVRFEQTICRGDELLAEAVVHTACLHASSFKPARIPEPLQHLLEGATE